MWFAGNSEYYFANPGFNHQLPSFGPDTYPNSRSHSGADSYIEINNISKKGETMSLTVDNSLLADGFPDTFLNIHFFFDFTENGVPEMIGGLDSLWWSYGDSLILQYFYELGGSNFHLCVTRDENVPLLALAEEIEDSVRIQVFQKHDVNGFEALWSNTVLSSFPHRVYGVPDSEMVVLDFFFSKACVTEDTIRWFPKQPIIFPDQPFDSLLEATATVWHLEDASSSKIDTGIVAVLSEGGISLLSNGVRTSGFHDISFSTISVVDLDLDGQIEIIATDKEGSIYAVNTHFTLVSGFPIPVKAISPVLARNLFTGLNPELVVQIESGDILVLDWQGKELYRLANSRGNDLRMLSQYQGKNCIVIRSSIWLFDGTPPTDGNEWSSIHHDPTNRRRLKASLQFRVPDEFTLIDTKRTYNYPNPVIDKTTTIRIFVESAEKIDIMIYDIAGFFVEKINIESPTQGEINEVIWDVSRIESGLYYANVLATKGNKSKNKILKIAVVH